MQRILFQIHQGLVRIFMAGLVLQFYLAGAPIFGVRLSFAPHRMLGFALTIAAILFLVLALVGRLGRKLISFSILLVSLTIVQAILPAFRVHAPWIAALHPVNALALMGITAAIRRNSRAETIQTN